MDFDFDKPIMVELEQITLDIQYDELCLNEGNVFYCFNSIIDISTAVGLITCLENVLSYQFERNAEGIVSSNGVTVKINKDRDGFPIPELGFNMNILGEEEFAVSQFEDLSHLEKQVAECRAVLREFLSTEKIFPETQHPYVYAPEYKNNVDSLSRLRIDGEDYIVNEWEGYQWAEWVGGPSENHRVYLLGN